MAKKKDDVAATAPESTTQTQAPTSASINAQELAQALTAAMIAAKGPEKKTAVNRKVNNPWTPKDGSAKLKLKRKAHQHGILLDEDMMDNEEITLWNRLRPGVFLEGHVRVTKRRDQGINIDYPVKTASQRLKLVNMFGIRNLKELLARCIDERGNPKQYEVVDYDE